MAERRMFAKTIIDSDAFLDMPISSQLLYFHLAMRADDDGFINKPKSIMRMCNCHDDDMRILISKQFVIPFDSGIVVIKHWNIHNFIKKDRYKETGYKAEKSRLELDENKAYIEHVPDMDTERIQVGYRLDTERIQTVSKVDTQVRLGKDSIVQDNNTMCNSDESHGENLKDSKPSKKEIDAFFESVWKLYPNKKGKGQISDSKKKALFEIGYDEIKRAIERYQQELTIDSSWRHPQNGSTFFNSGFVDYLDKNYTESKKDAQNANMGDISYSDDLDEYF